MRILVQEQGVEALPYLLGRLKDPYWSKRWDAVDILGYIADPRAVPGLSEIALGDDNAHPRWRSLWAISACDGKGDQILPIFANGLADPDPVRQWNAVVGLGFFHDRRAIPYLYEGLKSADSQVRWDAVDLLAKVHDERTSDLVAPLLIDPDPSVPREVTMTLAAVCDAKAKAILSQALEHADPEVRWRAAMGVRSCGDRTQVERLKQRLAVETSADALEHIQLALDALAKP